MRASQVFIACDNVKMAPQSRKSIAVVNSICYITAIIIVLIVIIIQYTNSSSTTSSSDNNSNINE